jgi:hypothetical protein
MEMPLNESGFAITHLRSEPNPKKKVPGKKTAKKNTASKSTKQSVKKPAKKSKREKAVKRRRPKTQPVGKSRTSRKLANKKKTKRG